MIIDALVNGMRSGRSLDSVAADWAKMPGIDVALIEHAMSRFRERAQNARVLRIPEALVDPGLLSSPWYPGPSPDDRFWPRLREHLQRTGLPATAITSIDEASTKIVSLLRAPGEKTIHSRGLVLGHVQSGKTSNFTAVIAKAADAGYRLFIVLSGVHNNLRRQTQVRLDEQLIGLNRGFWVGFTSQTGDFGRAPDPDAMLTLTERWFLCVVKKNRSRLEALLSWLTDASDETLLQCPILVIDDEADQASVNTAEADKQRTAINGLLVKLLRLPKAAYIGYTATPFANLFVDPMVPEDIYPRDFIVDLPRPIDYFGPERLFGRDPLDQDDEPEDGLDMIRRVNDDEIASLEPPRGKEARGAFSPALTPSLEAAIRYFFLASAARRARGQFQHSTMLIHTSAMADVHFKYRPPVEGLVRTLHKLVDRRDASEFALLADLWGSESGRVRAQDLDETPVPFEELAGHLRGVLDSTRVVVDNYRSQDRLDYTGHPSAVIVIGGNTLSRGLTLEGLVVSYFIRSASAYDTLLQMGRWFGYRRGYQDLPRIWLTADIEDWFRHLATVEEEIRQDVKRYESDGVTPMAFATRIRTHPQLAITSQMKMRHARLAKVSYAGRRVQTILFEHRNSDWLNNNLSSGRSLVQNALQAGIQPQRLPRGRWLFPAVDVTLVREFITTYRFHDNAVELDRDSLLRYIERQNEFGDLFTWNVAVMGRSRDEVGPIDLGLGSDVFMINRARMNSGKPYADIKSLMSKVDRVVDLDLAPEELQKDDRGLQSLRPMGTGLLLLYPISKDSYPMRGNARVRLEAAVDMLGVGMVFPDVPAERQYGEVEYMAVRLPEPAADLDAEELAELDRDLASVLEGDDEATYEVPEVQG